jgi:hypothetical protein
MRLAGQGDGRDRARIFVRREAGRASDRSLDLDFGAFSR